MSTLCFRMQIANGLAAFVVLVASNVSALAWGYEGHRIIAEIAEQFLEPETAHRVRDLLAIENRTTLAEVSTWADEIRPHTFFLRRRNIFEQGCAFVPVLLNECRAILALTADGGSYAAACLPNNPLLHSVRELRLGP
jgi:hypothetical protein